MKELHTVQVNWELDSSGRLVPKEIPGSERVWPAQLVFLALGFLGPEEQLLDQLKVEKDERSNAKAEYGKYAANVKGVFTAGDMRRGPSHGFNPFNRLFHTNPGSDSVFIPYGSCVSPIKYRSHSRAAPRPS